MYNPRGLMSALSFISNYGSSSDESDISSNASTQQPPRKKLKLRVPDLSHIPVVPSVTESELHLDDPLEHEGRVRSFPHVRGNWASFVYVKYSPEEALHTLAEKILEVLSTYKSSCHICDNIHISLSKTVVLQYHFITPFTKALQEVVNDIECFELEFLGIKIYCNEEKTRTFIALEVDYFCKKKLFKLTLIVDKILKEFKLPLFYENPSFHMSIIWINGNKKAELENLLTGFNNNLNEDIGSIVPSVLVSDLSCKIGNKYFQFSLK